MLPLTPATRGSFGKAEFEAMRSDAYLINLARGGIVDEAALREALRGKAIAGAAFDVLEQEPLPADSKLWNTPGLWLTPHVAGAFEAFLPRAVALYAENIHRLERGEAPHNPVDRARGY